jgi:ATP-dependent Lhr-like helicase
VFPDARLEPGVAVPNAPQYSREEALIEIVRGRLEALGPTTSASISTSLDMAGDDIGTALLALESEGTAMKGRFSSARDDGLLATGDSSPQSVEWCNRRLLARIHRYTVKRLRAEIEPVQPRDFLRFLFDWQRVTPSARMQGPDSVASVLAQLEGFDAPASAWESELLPMRIGEYDPVWLDEQCLAGRILWTRLAPRAGDAERGAAPVRSTPIALLARRHVKWWSSFVEQPANVQLTSKAERVAEFIQAHGASFFDEIVEHAGLLASQVEDALAELVAMGIVNADSFGGLRALLIPSDRRRPHSGHARRRRRVAIFGMQDAGRWGLVNKNMADGGRRTADGEEQAGANLRALSGYSLQPTAYSPAANSAAVEHLCRTLLARWGVVFWKLLTREADWLPPWRELLMCLRRLEARGEIRGGRFVAGYSGEQFALPEAIGPLREARRKALGDEFVAVSAADPLNLIGILTPGARLPSLTGNRVLYRDGLPIALYVGGEIKFLEALEPQAQWQAQNALLRRNATAAEVEERIGEKGIADSG